MIPSMLSVTDLSKQYRNTTVVQGVSFSIAAGEAVGLLGANGAGKSSMIKSILDLVRANSGTKSISGTYSYLPEMPQLPNSLSALTLLRFKCRANRLPETDAMAALEETGLSSNAYSRPLRSYSKGMKQRTSLALALCGKPDLILLDEPMSGLDALGRAEILSLLQQRKQHGTAMLMSSHIVTDMVRLCDRVMIMARGSIRETVTIKEHSLAEAEALEARLAAWQQP